MKIFILKSSIGILRITVLCSGLEIELGNMNEKGCQCQGHKENKFMPFQGRQTRQSDLIEPNLIQPTTHVLI